MDCLKKRIAKRPLIIAPQLPLAWTVCWLVMATMGRALGRPLATGSDVQESVLLLSAAVMVANIYNLVILYQRPDENHRQVDWLVISYALVLICSTVLAWGQPRLILLPQTLAGWPLVFLLLNASQAGLGIYFWQSWPRRKCYGEESCLPLWQVPVALGITALLLAALIQPGGGRRAVVLTSGVGLVLLLACQWRNRDRLFAMVPARLSAGYQVLLGGQLAALLFSLGLGGSTLVQRWNGEPMNLIGACFTISVLVVELTAGGLAAMQRYHLQYQYGLARTHRLRYRCLGALLVAGLLIGYCLA